MSSCREQNRSFIYIFFLLKQNKNKHLKYILLNNATSEVFFPTNNNNSIIEKRKRAKNSKCTYIELLCPTWNPGTATETDHWDWPDQTRPDHREIDQLLCFSHNHTHTKQRHLGVHEMAVHAFIRDEIYSILLFRPFSRSLIHLFHHSSIPY